MQSFSSSHPQVSLQPTPLPPSFLQIVPSPELDWTSPPFNTLFRDTITWPGSVHNTWRSYSSGIKHYIKFCNLANKLALPTTESTLFLFATYLASLNLSHPTIKVYLRSLYIAHGYHFTFNQQLTPRLQQVLKGIKNSLPWDQYPGSINRSPSRL